MVLELERTTSTPQANVLPEEGVSVPIEEYRLDILKIRRLMAEIANGGGFKKGVQANDEEIFNRYGERTHEIAENKKAKTERLQQELYDVLRRNEMLAFGLDRDEVEFHESSIRRNLKAVFAKSAKTRTANEEALMQRLETPIIEYPEESLQQYEELIEANPNLAGRRTAGDYRRGVREHKVRHQDSA